MYKVGFVYKTLQRLTIYINVLIGTDIYAQGFRRKPTALSGYLRTLSHAATADPGDQTRGVCIVQCTT